MALQIKDLDRLVAPLLAEGQQLGKSKISRLTGPGENYGSLMLSVDIKTKKGQNEETVHCVAKMCPPNQLIQKLFNTPVTFHNEIGFYKTIAPALREFQIEEKDKHLFNAFPACYGTRHSLDTCSEIIDENAIVLLQNLKPEGFKTLPKTTDFDLQGAKMVLKKLSQLHGITIALKLKKPEIFQKLLKPFFKEFRIFSDNTVEPTGDLIKLIEENKKYTANLTQLQKTLELNGNNFKLPKNTSKLHQDPFVTIVHMDLWVNNIMVKIEENRVVDVKFVDFQLFEYSTLARDLIFFLYSSVRPEIIQQSFEDLIIYYYDCLMDQMRSLHCDTAKFTFEAFTESFEFAAKNGSFFHVLFMLKVIFTDQKDAKEVEDLDMDAMVHQNYEFSKEFKDRFYFVVDEFIKREWVVVS